MAKFKNIPQTFLFRKLIKYWGNLVRNYNEDCRDNDVFDIVRNCFDHDKAVELIEAAYTPSELEDLSRSRFRRCRLDLADSLEDVFYALWNGANSREKCRAVLESMTEYMEADCDEGGGNDIVEARFRELVKVLKLDELEAEILMLAYICAQTCFSWPLHVEDREKPLYYAMALDRSYEETARALSPKGTLMKLGLLDDDYDFNRGMLGGFMDGTSNEAISRRFYTRSECKDVLPWEFFGELASVDGEVLKRMISTAGGKCNILLYGAPGTGKSSFAKALAKELGRTAYEVRQGDSDGKNMKAEARMIGIKVCNGQESSDEGMIIIDEADELLRGSSCGFSIFGFPVSSGKSTEKGITNTILDEMSMPAVWISNAPAYEMDESVRRRFDYSICFERLNNSQRVSIWRNQVAKHGLGKLITEEMIADYAVKYETSAGGISTVLSNVKRMNPAPDRVDELVATLMKPHCKLMGVRSSSDFLPAKGYSLDGLNVKGKITPARIVKAVRNYLDASFSEAGEDKPRMNILLHGAPGTGKTEFVKYLGKELDRKVIVVKGSDLLSKFVGESEQNIARAFRRAEAERAILFFDEVDGLLQDRSHAQASWEVTQVNELLQQMENFNGVMVAATNFSKNLDPATMRRFTFKLEFCYLDEAGRKSFFERMFKRHLEPAELDRLNELENLAPGDFRTVRQGMFYLDDDPTNLELIEALKEECLAKRDGSRCSCRIGFGS